jgi:hypothetical protein
VTTALVGLASAFVAAFAALIVAAVALAPCGMIGVGALVARELLGEPQALLEPFRFSRYTTGKFHPISTSPFPWS